MNVMPFRGTARFCSSMVMAPSALTPKTKVIVLGVTSHLAASIVRRALEIGHTVIGTSRASDFKGLNPSKNLELSHIPRDKVTDVEAWKRFAESKLFLGDSVLVVNAMGGAHCEGDETLLTKNIDPVVAALDGIQTVAKVRGLKKFHFLNISSLAAEICSDSGYGKAKKECDNILLARGPEDMTILRVSYAMNPPAINGGITPVSDEHWYAADQLAAMPFQIVLGDKEVPMQPVAHSDIADVVCNSLSFKGKEIINAVGPEIVTQVVFAGFFAKVLGKDFNPILVNPQVGTLLAKHFSKGHFSLYAIDAINKGGILRDPGPFKLRKRGPLLSIEDQYKMKENDEISIVAPPIKEHLKEIFKKIIRSPEAARDAFLAGRIFIADQFSTISTCIFARLIIGFFGTLCKGAIIPVKRDGVSYKVKITDKDEFNEKARLNINKFAQTGRV